MTDDISSGIASFADATSTVSWVADSIIDMADPRAGSVASDSEITKARIILTGRIRIPPIRPYRGVRHGHQVPLTDIVTF